MRRDYSPSNPGPMRGIVAALLFTIAGVAVVGLIVAGCAALAGGAAMAGWFDDDERPVSGWRLGLLVALVIGVLVAGILWGDPS